MTQAWKIRFHKHLESELKAGKPLKQALEIAYQKCGEPNKNPEYGDRSKIERDLIKKAQSWYGDDSLVTDPKPLRGYEAPNAVVEIGEMVAIEYGSMKFDGKQRIYRHECTKKRKCFISLDGSTIIIWPPFKVTKRGIEG
jgi:hypothetical protein